MVLLLSQGDNFPKLIIAEKTPTACYYSNEVEHQNRVPEGLIFFTGSVLILPWQGLDPRSGS